MKSFTFVALALLVGQALGDAASDLETLYGEEWEYRLEQFPGLARMVGDERYGDRLSQQSLEAIAARAQFYRDLVQRFEAIGDEGLDPEQRLNRALFERQIRQVVTDFDTNAHLLTLNSDSGFHTSLARMGPSSRLENLKDYEDYLKRLEQVGRVIDQNIELMTKGIEIGMVQPRVVLNGRDVAIADQVVDDPLESGFYAPLKSLPDSISESDAQDLRQRAKTVIADSVVPAYARFLAFFNGPYMEAARTELSASSFPNGEAFYQGQIVQYTTLDLTPQQIHQIGLDEVARILGEMHAIIEEVKFDGDFAAFLKFLRTDEQFYAETPHELLAEAAYFAKKMDGKLPEFFGHLPRQPYGVDPVPDSIAPYYTAGRYVSAPADSTRAGKYWVNTHDLSSRTLYTLPALTLHEAVPGHHLQIALASEQEEQPPFRRYDYISAFGEGWALYAEFLGVEAGIYETPYQHFGRLTYEMWRACRLVVDTGVHHLGWSRERAVKYMQDHTALSLHEIETEIDRYISWPAQALSYKLGEIKIRELRTRATETLGSDFNLRDFHDQILKQGSVPLSILDEIVDEWIASVREAN